MKNSCARSFLKEKNTNDNRYQKKSYETSLKIRNKDKYKSLSDMSVHRSKKRRNVCKADTLAH